MSGDTDAHTVADTDADTGAAKTLCGPCEVFS